MDTFVLKSISRLRPAGGGACGKLCKMSETARASYGADTKATGEPSGNPAELLARREEERRKELALKKRAELDCVLQPPKP